MFCVRWDFVVNADYFWTKTFPYQNQYQVQIEKMQRNKSCGEMFLQNKVLFLFCGEGDNPTKL